MRGGYVPGAAGDDGPYFFLSFARTSADDHGGQDPDHWIAQLYNDLCQHVESLTYLPPGEKPGFMDRESRQGQEWPRRLSWALATCRVFVPLYSRRYFKSEHCGKEWFSFNRRRLNQRASDAHPSETIIPALWIPVPDSQLPDAARSVHFEPSDFGQLYAEHGFYGTMKVRRWRDAYEEAVYLLARRIVNAAEYSPVAPGPLDAYESPPSAFGGTDLAGPGDKSLRLTVVAPRRDELPGGRDQAYYGKDVREWNPYQGDSVRSLADHTPTLFTHPPRLVLELTSGLTVTTRAAASGASRVRSSRARPSAACVVATPVGVRPRSFGTPGGAWCGTGGRLSRSAVCAHSRAASLPSARRRQGWSVSAPRCTASSRICSAARFA